MSYSTHRSLKSALADISNNWLRDRAGGSHGREQAPPLLPEAGQENQHQGSDEIGPGDVSWELPGMSESEGDASLLHEGGSIHYEPEAGSQETLGSSTGSSQEGGLDDGDDDIGGGLSSGYNVAYDSNPSLSDDIEPAEEAAFEAYLGELRDAPGMGPQQDAHYLRTHRDRQDSPGESPPTKRARCEPPGPTYDGEALDQWGSNLRRYDIHASTRYGTDSPCRHCGGQMGPLSLSTWFVGMWDGQNHYQQRRTCRDCGTLEWSNPAPLHSLART